MDEKQRNSRAVRRAVALAATAVVAVTTGCTAQASGAGAGPAVTAGGVTKPAAPAFEAADAPSAEPSPDATPTKAPPKEPAAAPAPSRTEVPEPRPETEPPAPRTLMASGSGGDQVRELQARLRQIAHFNRTPTGHYGPVTAAAVSSFQDKRGLPRTGTTDTVTWDRLLGMTREPTRAELRPPAADPVAKPDPRCMKGRVLCISKTSRTLSWMVEGRVVSVMDVRFGSQYTPTREGTFEVYWKSRHHVSTLYDSPMPYALFFSGGQAVHYSSDFAARGYSGASHGCVNVRDEAKIASLFAQVRDGDKVVVHW
ncbi:L,D-transpeptidase family protein [Streptomyces sp. Wb2n-11]|uniref:L,D-transpeptidase family protein n=1 Tax=Streptomyces sp. Wb2n-11 TaxID=1030533 RepID=UPI000B28C6A3|nr:L,D-transpeptidase family protein [Streptomyces sp. Wb2n-11]